MLFLLLLNKLQNHMEVGDLVTQSSVAQLSGSEQKDFSVFIGPHSLELPLQTHGDIYFQRCTVRMV